eukprot:GHRR01020396.1.p1 GENE.GHRR01020396.1~~GHRR01020396.1.p1  ORF type:complete len:162 (+),score=57.91 GHRR01020396.1:246-731(+)
MSQLQQLCRQALRHLKQPVQQQLLNGSHASDPLALIGTRWYARLPASQHVCRPEQPEAGDQQHQLQQKQLQSSKQQPVWKLYKSKWIVPVRFLVRAKVFQLLGGGSIGLILAGITMQQVAIGDIVALSALAGGMVAASCCLWYYSRRYVNDMRLLPDISAR